jgi:hypothetical protein
VSSAADQGGRVDGDREWLFERHSFMPPGLADGAVKPVDEFQGQDRRLGRVDDPVVRDAASS